MVASWQNDWNSINVVHCVPILQMKTTETVSLRSWSVVEELVNLGAGNRPWGSVV